MGSPRLAVVFCFWQCDKKNHGWREGPPVTGLCQSFRSAGRAFTLRQNQSRTKKRIQLSEVGREPSIRTLAGNFRLLGNCSDSGVMRRSPVVLPLQTQAHCRP